MGCGASSDSDLALHSPLTADADATGGTFHRRSGLLDISGQALNEIPRIKDAGLVRHLNASNNFVVDLPSTSIMKVWKVLESLDLSSNRIVRVPRAIADIPALTSLDLSNNALNLLELPPCSQLQRLVLAECKLRKLPKAITSQYMRLATLDFSFNQFIDIAGSDLPQLPLLSTLLLRGCGLKGRLPWEIADCKALTTLDIGGNTFDLLSEASFGDHIPRTLSTLGMCACGTVVFPRAVASLRGLTSLDLSRNALSSIAGVGALSKLATLSLAACRLRVLPHGCEELPQLTSLDIAENDFLSLAALAEEFPCLRSISVRESRWTAGQDANPTLWRELVRCTTLEEVTWTNWGSNEKEQGGRYIYTTRFPMYLCPLKLAKMNGVPVRRELFASGRAVDTLHSVLMDGFYKVDFFFDSECVAAHLAILSALLKEAKENVEYMPFIDTAIRKQRQNNETRRPSARDYQAFRRRSGDEDLSASGGPNGAATFLTSSSAGGATGDPTTTMLLTSSSSVGSPSNAHPASLPVLASNSTASSSAAFTLNSNDTSAKASQLGPLDTAGAPLPAVADEGVAALPATADSAHQQPNWVGHSFESDKSSSQGGVGGTGGLCVLPIPQQLAVDAPTRPRQGLAKSLQRYLFFLAFLKADVAPLHSSPSSGNLLLQRSNSRRASSPRRSLLLLGTNGEPSAACGPSAAVFPMVPPLDVAVLHYAHMTVDPAAYAKDCSLLFHHAPAAGLPTHGGNTALGNDYAAFLAEQLLVPVPSALRSQAESGAFAKHMSRSNSMSCGTPPLRADETALLHSQARWDQRVGSLEATTGRDLSWLRYAPPEGGGEEAEDVGSGVAAQGGDTSIGSSMDAHGSPGQLSMSAKLAPASPPKPGNLLASPPTSDGGAAAGAPSLDDFACANKVATVPDASGVTLHDLVPGITAASLEEVSFTTEPAALLSSFFLLLLEFVRYRRRYEALSQECVVRYAKFLVLTAKEGDGMAPVPTLGIHLILSLHRSRPQRYQQDLDFLGIKEVKWQLTKQSSLRTVELWQKYFDEKLSLADVGGKGGADTGGAPPADGAAAAMAANGSSGSPTPTNALQEGGHQSGLHHVTIAGGELSPTNGSGEGAGGHGVIPSPKQLLAPLLPTLLQPSTAGGRSLTDDTGFRPKRRVTITTADTAETAI